MLLSARRTEAKGDDGTGGGFGVMLGLPWAAERLPFFFFRQGMKTVVHTLMRWHHKCLRCGPRKDLQCYEREKIFGNNLGRLDW